MHPAPLFMHAPAHIQLRSAPATGRATLQNRSVANEFDRSYSSAALIASVGIAGAWLIGGSLLEVSADFGWMVLAVLTVVSGFFVVKMPGVSATLSISETFLFTQLLMFGPAAAIVTAAIDGVALSCSRRNLTPARALFNITEPAVSLAATAAVLTMAERTGPAHPARTACAVLLAAVVYLCANIGLTGLALAANTGRSPFGRWFRELPWLWLNYVGGAALALIVTSTGGFVWYGIALTIPVLSLIYFTFHRTAAGVEEARRHVQEVNDLHLSTVETLALAVDAKDQITHGHIRRVQRNARMLAGELGIADPSLLKAIDTAGLLHDIGKLAIPDHLLNKPGRLTPSEYEQIKCHAPIGADMLSTVNFPYPLVPIIRHHHENWDGTGYPDGLKAEAIPIGARVLAVVDCYDALTSDRPYRTAMTATQAVALICERTGTMYDPTVVAAFMRVQPLLPVGNGTAAAANEAIAVTRSAVKPTYEHPARNDEQIVQVAQRILADTPAQLVVWYRPDAQTGRLIAHHAVGLGADRLRARALQAASGISGWVAVTKTTITNSDPSLDFLAAGIEPGPLASGSTLAIAVNHLSAISDVITIYSPEPARFSAADERHILRLLKTGAASQPTGADGVLPFEPAVRRSEAFSHMAACR